MELLERLGIDTGVDADSTDGENALRQVAAILGAYPGAKAALDDAPRRSDIEKALRRLRKRAYALCSELSNLDDWSRDAVQAQGAEVQELISRLATFYDAAGTALTSQRPQESRGRPQRLALKDTVAKLQNIFSEKYRGDPSSTHRRGAVQPKSARENDELEFVKVALEAADINLPDRLEDYLRTS